MVLRERAAIMIAQSVMSVALQATTHKDFFHFIVLLLLLDAPIAPICLWDVLFLNIQIRAPAHQQSILIRSRH